MCGWWIFQDINILKGVAARVLEVGDQKSERSIFSVVFDTWKSSLGPVVKLNLIGLFSSRPKRLNLAMLTSDVLMDFIFSNIFNNFLVLGICSRVSDVDLEVRCI